VVDDDSIGQQFAQRRPKLRTLSSPPRAVRDDLHALAQRLIRERHPGRVTPLRFLSEADAGHRRVRQDTLRLHVRHLMLALLAP